MGSEQLDSPGLRRLLDAVTSVSSDLSLEVVLHKVVEAAVELVGARYGALGVLDERRERLAEFISVGLDDETRTSIGDLPKGLGLLGSLIRSAQPMRLAELTDHADSVGFPPNHPAMQSFLGVPVHIRGEVFGNLYLADKLGSPTFDDADEELATGEEAGMSSEDHNGTTGEGDRLHVLSYEDCLRLLATKDVGHLAVMIGYYPQVFTVNYRLDDFVVVFRTHAGTKLSAAHHHNVGFHVDHVDPVTRTGWSVLVQGMADGVSGREGDPATDRARALQVQPWAGGDREELVRIIPAHVTGRRLERVHVEWPDSDVGFL